MPGTYSPKDFLCTHTQDNTDLYLVQNPGSDKTSSSFLYNQTSDSNSQLVLDKNTKNTSLNHLQNSKSLMLSSKRLVPTLYQCKNCNLTFENQVEMGDHFNRIKHEGWIPSPQRPLTIQARQKDTRYSY